MTNLKISNFVLFMLISSLLGCVSSSSSSQPVRTTSSNLPVPEKMDFPIELQNLQSQWQKVKTRFDRLPLSELEKWNEGSRIASSSIAYILENVQKTFKEEKKTVALEQVPNAQMDLNLAESLVADLEVKKDPFTNRKGDMHLAYRSEVDNALQPFRLYIPEDLNLDQQHPLIVGLHGRSGDENTIMDSYGDRQRNNSIFKQKGRTYGFILVTPKGRDASLGYQNAAEKDVLDVTNIVVKLYAVKESAIFLTGHSMGGDGTMLIGLKSPKLFKALAPIAGGLWVAGSMNNLSMDAKVLPVQFYHGTADTVVPADPNALATTKKTLSNFKFVEYAGEDHSSIFFKSVPEVFQFFADLQK